MKLWKIVFSRIPCQFRRPFSHWSHTILFHRRCVAVHPFLFFVSFVHSQQPPSRPYHDGVGLFIAIDEARDPLFKSAAKYPHTILTILSSREELTHFFLSEKNKFTGWKKLVAATFYPAVWFLYSPIVLKILDTRWWKKNNNHYDDIIDQITSFFNIILEMKQKS